MATTSGPPQEPTPGQAPARAQAQAPAGSVAQPGSEELLYHGPAKHGALAWDYVKWVLVGAAGGALAYGLGMMSIFASWPLWPLSLIGIPGIIWTFFKHATSRFKLTLRRIEIEHGVLSKTVDSLEMWRVLDVRFNQSLFDRMLGVAKITVMSTDQTSPELVLYGLPNARILFERLRDAVQLARHSNRPMELVGGEHGGLEDLAHHHQ
jgi:membrane protein YdbS with pleckstrin-like domain